MLSNFIKRFKSTLVNDYHNNIFSYSIKNIEQRVNILETDFKKMSNNLLFVMIPSMITICGILSGGLTYIKSELKEDIKEIKEDNKNLKEDIKEFKKEIYKKIDRLEDLIRK